MHNVLPGEAPYQAVEAVYRRSGASFAQLSELGGNDGAGRSSVEERITKAGMLGLLTSLHGTSLQGTGLHGTGGNPVLQNPPEGDRPQGTTHAQPGSRSSR
jgi:hypothetical protein